MNNILDFFKFENNRNIYLQLYMLLKIYLTMPCTSCKCERSFSCLKRIKSYLRSTMCQTRLSSISVINVEREFINLLNLDECLDIFINRNQRYLKFKI
jgi:hypothetical protein